MVEARYRNTLRVALSRSYNDFKTLSRQTFTRSDLWATTSSRLNKLLLVNLNRITEEVTKIKDNSLNKIQTRFQKFLFELLILHYG